VGEAVPIDNVLDKTSQSLLSEAIKTLNLNEGETTMFIADVPNAPASMPQVVLVAQANTSQQNTTKSEHVLGVCGVVYSGQADIFPLIY